MYDIHTCNIHRPDNVELHLVKGIFNSFLKQDLISFNRGWTGLNMTCKTQNEIFHEPIYSTIYFHKEL